LTQEVGAVRPKTVKAGSSVSSAISRCLSAATLALFRGEIQ